MTRKLLASSALAALMAAGTIGYAGAQTETQQPAAEQPAAQQPMPADSQPADTSAAAGATGETKPTLTPDQPTLASAFMGQPVYSSQDPEQDTYDFHGLQTVGADGRYAFTTVKPVEYTVPSDGPVGDILRACGRHPWRPSHLHFIAEAEGFRPLVTEVFPEDDPYLDQDTVFGVRADLVMRYQPMPAGSFPATGFDLSGRVPGDYLKVTFDLTLVAA